MNCHLSFLYIDRVIQTYLTNIRKNETGMKHKSTEINYSFAEQLNYLISNEFEYWVSLNICRSVELSDI